MGLESMLTERNVDAFKITKKILDTYSHVFDAIFSSIGTGINVEWVTVDFHPSNKAVINIIGILKRTIGETMYTDAKEVIYIDETNVDHYSRPVRMILPLHLVELYDVEGLKLFVQEVGEMVSQSSHDELDILIGDDTFLSQTFSAFKSTNELERNTPLPIQYTDNMDENISAESHKVGKIDRSTLKYMYDVFNLEECGLDEIQLQSLWIMKPEGQS